MTSNGRMKKLLAVAGAVAVTVTVAGCDGCNGGITHSGKKISEGIIKKVEGICGATPDTPRGGVMNIMLMEDREDDGIVTCRKVAPGDKTVNYYFDA